MSSRRCTLFALRGGFLVLLTLEAAAPASADPIQLNFAAVNQSPWSTGGAFILDKRIEIPDPHLNGHVNIEPISLDPVGALLDLLGLDVPSLVSLEASPSVTFDAGLWAHYHVNGGALDLNYPQAVQLNLPDRIPTGEFTVSASYPGADPAAHQFGLGQVATVAGHGYGRFVGSPQIIGQDFAPIPGFTTTFPFAEAQLGVSVSASAAVTVEGCFLLFCEDHSISLPGMSHNQQLLEISTIKGIKVFDQPVVQFPQTVEFPGWGELSVNPPSLSVDGTIRADKSLRGNGTEDIIDFAFDLEQLIPIVGPLLHREYAGFGYELLNLQPHATLGLYQKFSFTPQLKVDLEFSAPVIHNGQATNTVRFGLGEEVTLRASATGYASGGSMQIKPTFVLENQFRNETGIYLAGSMDVRAFTLQEPIGLEPAFETTLDLFTLELPPLFNEPAFSINVPPITTDTVTLARDVDLADIYRITRVLDDDLSGVGTWELNLADMYGAYVTGTTMRAAVVDRPDGIPHFPYEQEVLVATEDVIVDNPQNPYFGVNLGRVFCIFCYDTSGYFLPENPSMSDLVGTLFFSDLSTFPILLTEEEVLSTDSVLAESNYYSRTIATEGSLEPEPVPEPGTVVLLGAGLVALGLRFRRAAARSGAGRR